MNPSYLDLATSTRATFTAYDDVRDAGLSTPDNIQRFDDLRYGTESMHLLDIYAPKDVASPLPTIVSIHGGGWVYGDKERYQHYCMNLAQRGFAVVNFSYRLAPEAPYPAALLDTNMVFHWLAAHASAYPVDLNRLFVVGDSAGAQLAAQYLAILTNPTYRTLFSMEPPTLTIRGAALNCGFYDLRNTDHQELFAPYFQGREQELAPQLDVISAITAAFPPTYLMTACYDFLKTENAPLVNALLQAGVPFQFRMYGSAAERGIAHVFHLDIRSETAILCNDAECAFFHSLL